jgi:DNA-binding response OmpR family regulator
MAGRLLVVSDEPRTGHTLRRALALDGFAVVLVTDDAGAVEIVRDTELDAVIVAVVEPEGRGAALRSRLREARPRLPVLVVGTGDTAVGRTGGFDAGAHEYLAKPVVLVALLTRLRRASAKKEPRRL